MCALFSLLEKLMETHVWYEYKTLSGRNPKGVRRANQDDTFNKIKGRRQSSGLVLSMVFKDADFLPNQKGVVTVSWHTVNSESPEVGPTCSLVTQLCRIP